MGEGELEEDDNVVHYHYQFKLFDHSKVSMDFEGLVYCYWPP